MSEFTGLIGDDGTMPITTVVQAREIAETILANVRAWAPLVPAYELNARGDTREIIEQLHRHCLCEIDPIGWEPNTVEVRGEPTTDILDAIDNALGCQCCGRPLGASPSDDFCSPECLRAWHADRAVPLDPDSPDAARVYVGHDDRPVPLDEGESQSRVPWPSPDLLATLDAFQARQITVEVNESTNTAIVHVEPRPESPLLTSWRRAWNLLTGRRDG